MVVWLNDVAMDDDDDDGDDDVDEEFDGSDVDLRRAGEGQDGPCGEAIGDKMILEAAWCECG